MGKCVFCGQGAGIFRKKHKECESRNAKAQVDVLNRTGNIVQQSTNMAADLAEMKSMALQNFVGPETLARLVGTSLSASIDKILDDGLLSEDEESRLSEFLEETEKQEFSLNTDEAKKRIVKNSINFLISR